MTDAAEVSVVLAVRDSSRDALLGVESVLAQEGVALELIVVDDGSTKGLGLVSPSSPPPTHACG